MFRSTEANRLCRKTAASTIDVARKLANCCWDDESPGKDMYVLVVTSML